jgi:hypothetical protein
MQNNSAAYTVETCETHLRTFRIWMEKLQRSSLRGTARVEKSKESTSKNTKAVMILQIDN